MKFELGEEVKIRTSAFTTGVVLASGIIWGMDGGKSEMYVLFFDGEKRGYFSEFELEKKK